MYAEIKCPKCHSEVQVDQIDFSSNKAKCLTCQHTYSIQNAIKKLRKKVRVELPERFSTTKSINHLELDIPWNTNLPSALKKFHGCFKFLSFVPVIIAVVFLSFWTVGFTQQSLQRGETLSLIIVLVITIAIIGFIIRNFTSRKHRNNTLITIDENQLKISVPLLQPNEDGKTQFPIKKPKFSLDKSTIIQLYVVRSTHFYKVLILDFEGNIHDPMYPFFNLEDALYIEQSIEDILDISDKIIDDEIKL